MLAAIVWLIASASLSVAGEDTRIDFQVDEPAEITATVPVKRVQDIASISRPVELRPEKSGLEKVDIQNASNRKTSRRKIGGKVSKGIQRIGIAVDPSLAPTRSETSVSAEIPALKRLSSQSNEEGLNMFKSMSQTQTTDAAKTMAEKNARASATEFCTNLAPSAAAASLAFQAEKIAALDARITERIAQLEAKRAEYQSWYDKQEIARRKASDAVVEIYAKMKPEAASLQMAAMEETAAAALLSKLNPRAASTILNEMEAGKAARLTDVMTRTKAP